MLWESQSTALAFSRLHATGPLRAWCARCAAQARLFDIIRERDVNESQTVPSFCYRTPDPSKRKGAVSPLQKGGAATGTAAMGLWPPLAWWPSKCFFSSLRAVKGSREVILIKCSVRPLRPSCHGQAALSIEGGIADGRMAKPPDPKVRPFTYSSSRASEEDRTGKHKCTHLCGRKKGDGRPHSRRFDGR